jgi:hypothetical protein
MLANGQGPSEEQLSLAISTRVHEEHGEIIEGRGHLRMLRTQRGLTNGQRSAEKRLSLSVPAGDIKKFCEIIEACGHLGTVRTQGVLANGQRPAEERLRFAVVTVVNKLAGEGVQLLDERLILGVAVRNPF